MSRGRTVLEYWITISPVMLMLSTTAPRGSFSSGYSSALAVVLASTKVMVSIIVIVKLLLTDWPLSLTTVYEITNDTTGDA